MKWVGKVYRSYFDLMLVGFINEVLNTWKCRTMGIGGVICGFSESLTESVILRGGDESMGDE